MIIDFNVLLNKLYNELNNGDFPDVLLLIICEYLRHRVLVGMFESYISLIDGWTLKELKQIEFKHGMFEIISMTSKDSKFIYYASKENLFRLHLDANLSITQIPISFGPSQVRPEMIKICHYSNDRFITIVDRAEGRVLAWMNLQGSISWDFPICNNKTNLLLDFYINKKNQNIIVIYHNGIRIMDLQKQKLICEIPFDFKINVDMRLRGILNDEMILLGPSRDFTQSIILTINNGSSSYVIKNVPHQYYSDVFHHYYADVVIYGQGIYRFDNHNTYTYNISSHAFPLLHDEYVICHHSENEHGFLIHAIIQKQNSSICLDSNSNCCFTIPGNKNLNFLASTMIDLYII